MSQTERRSNKEHVKFAYRVAGNLYDILWLSVASKGELYAVLPSHKKHKKIQMPLYNEGKVIEENANLDHITFHNTGRVHWRVKGKKYINKCNLKTSIFELPAKEVIGLFSFTIALDEISRTHPLSQGAQYVFGAVKTKFATIVCYLAHVSNAINFYEEKLKEYDGCKTGPIFIDTGINGKMLIIMKTELVPGDVYNGYLTKQLAAASMDTKAALALGNIGTLLPADYFERYLVPSR
jgi:hypothetical protein